MFAKIENWLTLGNQYVAASVVYLGLALILGGTTRLDTPRVWANEEEEPDCVRYEDQEGVMVPIYGECPEGEECCKGEDKNGKIISATCIPIGDLCCEDGTSGDDTCECCSGCKDEPGTPCAVPPPPKTYTCPD